MVRLQRVLAYSRKDKEGKNRDHYKNFVNLPDEAVKKLGWAKGQELDWNVQKGVLILKPVGKVRAVKPVKKLRNVKK